MGTERKKNDGAAMDRKKQTEQTKPEEETRAGQPSARVDLSSGEYTYTDGTPTPEEGGGQSAQGEDTRKPSHPSQPPPPHRCGFCGASFAHTSGLEQHRFWSKRCLELQFWRAAGQKDWAAAVAKAEEVYQKRCADHAQKVPAPTKPGRGRRGTPARSSGQAATPAARGRSTAQPQAPAVRLRSAPVRQRRSETAAPPRRARKHKELRRRQRSSRRPPSSSPPSPVGPRHKKRRPRSASSSSDTPDRPRRRSRRVTVHVH